MAITVPMYYDPRPYQKKAWARHLSGNYHYEFRIWHRQSGKDTDHLQNNLNYAFLNPGTQSCYIGLDNKWIKRNIWDKYIDGRKHWADYPSSIIDVRETAQQVRMLNNPADKAPALIQFIGFKESQSLIGSSYDRFTISELSLYKRGAFDFIQPIWDMKKASGADLRVLFNFTPRGMSNVAADMLRAYTGEDDPAKWPGEHGDVFVDFMPATQSFNSDGSRLISDEMLEDIRQRYIRAMGNDNAFRQEYLCEFLTTNAGLVFPGIELVRSEGRYCPTNFVSSKPVFMAWDISSKDKQSDWTSCIIFQFYNGRMFILDWFEDNRKAVVECVQEVAKRDYFHLIRAACLPWDSDRSGSSSSPLDECRRAFPNISWYKLDRSYVNDGINRGRALLGNCIIDSTRCDWLMECFENWEYRQLSGQSNTVVSGSDWDSNSDWSATPKHDRYSHLMDAFRYAAEFINQVPSIRSTDGFSTTKMPDKYPAWDLNNDDSDWDDMPPGMRPSKFSKLRNKTPKELYG